MDDVSNVEIDKIVKGIRENLEVLLSDAEAQQLYRLVHKAEKIEGDLAEVGVYCGGTARIIREASKEKDLYLFDTFDGLPKLGKEDESPELHKGLYKCDLDRVKTSLQNYKNIHYYPGLFPTTAIPIKDKQFSFVHLDADLYKSTLSALKFFYPRLAVGGIILSHDYPGLSGVKKAFDEFFVDKKELIVEFSGCSQAMVIKLG